MKKLDNLSKKGKLILIAFLLLTIWKGAGILDSQYKIRSCMKDGTQYFTCETIVKGFSNYKSIAEINNENYKRKLFKEARKLDAKGY